jgi:broad specificity phosphatase PhoE
MREALTAPGAPTRLTTVFCLRHAESVDNAERVYASRPPRVGLTDRGRAQAAEAG